jgi:uncharacterized repeat protein (TIGR03803 family)
MHTQYPKFRSARSNRGRRQFIFGLCVIAVSSLTAGTVMAQGESVLYSFAEGSGAYARPYEASPGLLYVPSYYGGKAGQGAIVQVSEKHGEWKGKTIFSFGGRNGENPAAGLNQDPDGILYGTTEYGGAHHNGTVFSLTPGKSGWTETVLYNFTGHADGGTPNADILRDKSTGALYGTTPTGAGKSGCGTAFALTPSNGNWTFNVLYDFAGGIDGCNPDAGFRAGTKTGTYFSTTSSGGTGNSGTVYELAESNGNWTETVLYSFTGGADGNQPVDLDHDLKGNLYGVTAAGGTYGLGVAFELAYAHQNWTQSVIYNFYTDSGSNPDGLHMEESTGTLYGATNYGGTYGNGTVFELTKDGSSWKETVLHSFGATQGDGINPQSRPVEDPETGAIYGTTAYGGANGGGVVYEVTP